MKNSRKRAQSAEKRFGKKWRQQDEKKKDIFFAPIFLPVPPLPAYAMLPDSRPLLGVDAVLLANVELIRDLVERDGVSLEFPIGIGRLG